MSDGIDVTMRMEPRHGQQRRRAVVVFADIVGYTAVSAEDDVRALRLVQVLQDAAGRCIPAHGGRIVRFVGDAVLAEFAGAEAAVRAALALRESFVAASATEGEPATLHTGVHAGELTQAEDGDIYGASVNLAARLQTEAAAGQVLVSEDVARQLQTGEDLALHPVGPRRLKGFAEPIPVWSVRLPGEASVGRAGSVAAAQESAQVRATRLIVLPFRMLRPDPDTDFLAFGLADALTARLAGLRSLVVRSSLAALRYGEQPDLRVVGADAAVDLVLTGTLLRAGDRVRVTAQLTEVDTGTVLWSESQQVAVGDLFQLQDDLTQRVVSSVATPLTARERRLIRQDVPATARAYELYLRGSEAGALKREWALARELYTAALAEDPEFAPAWAQLGRCCRLLSKYSLDPEVAARIGRQAEDAFGHALALNPDLPIAHGFYAQFEVERGRPREAMVRLVERAQLAAPDASIFSGLVHALRYCGLVEESIAADRLARRLDPNVVTSVEYAWMLLDRPAEVLEASASTRGDVRDMALVGLGRLDDARAWIASQLERYASLPMGVVFLPMLEMIRAGLHGTLEVERADALLRLVERFPDAEGRFIVARWLARFGLAEQAVEALRLTVDRYHCDTALRHDSWLESVRGHPDFPALVERAAAGRERALTAWLEVGGPEMLEQQAPVA